MKLKYYKMDKLIDQIKLFHSLNLQPISLGELKIWKFEIEKNLIRTNNIIQYHVKINQITIEAKGVEKQLIERTKRACKQARCCEICEKN